MLDTKSVCNDPSIPPASEQVKVKWQLINVPHRPAAAGILHDIKKWIGPAGGSYALTIAASGN